jgi:hypothetical protein
MGLPQPLHRRDVNGFGLFHLFNKDRQEALQQSYKLKPPAKVSKHHSISITHRGLDQALCLDHRHRRLPAPCAQALEITSTSLSVYPSPGCSIEAPPLSRIAIDATATSDDASTLRESTKPHATQKPRSTMPSRFDVSDKGDAHRSASGSLQPEPTFKDDVHKWLNDAARRHHLTRETRI